VGDDHPITRNDGPGVEAWEAWTPAEAAHRIAGAGVTWWVVGGWAIDLFLGEQTREHEDLEIAVLQKDFPTLRQHLGSLEFFAVGSGQIISLANQAEVPEEFHQRWALEPAAAKWRVDLMLQPGDGEEWVFRRDESITAPRASIVALSADGIPFELPQGVLLYKAKAARPKDEADFVACLPHMSAADRRWLAQALTHAHPGHRWIRALD
jgi:hypothetical protein